MTPERLSLVKPGDYIKYGDYKHSSVMRVTHVEGDVIVGRSMNGYACSTYDRDVLAVATHFAPAFIEEASDLPAVLASGRHFLAVTWDNGRGAEHVEVDHVMQWEEATDADR